MNCFSVLIVLLDDEMNYWRWLEMRIPVDDFVTEALPAPWPCGLPYATPAPCAVWLAREPPPAPPLPCVLEGRSWGTDLPRLLLSGFVCLNFALLAMLPATGYVCIRPKKLCFEPAGLLAAGWFAAPFLTMKSEESLFWAMEPMGVSWFWPISC